MGLKVLIAMIVLSSLNAIFHGKTLRYRSIPSRYLIGPVSNMRLCDNLTPELSHLAITEKIMRSTKKKSPDGLVLVKHPLLSRKRSMNLYMDKSQAYVHITKQSVTLDDAQLCVRLLDALRGCSGTDDNRNTKGNVDSPRASRLVAVLGHESISLPAIQVLRIGDVSLVTPHTLSSMSQDTGIRPAGDDIASWQQHHKSSSQLSFYLNSPFPASKHQLEAVANISTKIKAGNKFQTLLGATGTGKTFMMASVIADVNKPTLILAPNKVLAAQLVNEMREFLPQNSVEFFVSYYDYYLPESYRSTSDTYVDKVVQINEDIDRMRHSATRSLLERNDVVVVSSISCIYGLGMPAHYAREALTIVEGDELSLNALEAKLKKLSYVNVDQLDDACRGAIDYGRNEREGGGIARGQFRLVVHEEDLVTVEIGPSSDSFNVLITLKRSVYSSSDSNRKAWTIESVVRVDRDTGEILESRTDSENDSSINNSNKDVERGWMALEGCRLIKSRNRDDFDAEAVSLSDEEWVKEKTTMALIHEQARRLTGQLHMPSGRATIYPASHHVLGSDERATFLERVESELQHRYTELSRQGHVLEAQRLRQRTEADLLMLRALGTCKGIENYSRHLAGRETGAPPDCLIDYFGKDWLLVVDESHITVPQVRSMFFGDRSRKLNLVKHGFRLPSALDNRPLMSDEFWSRVKHCLFTSATPGRFEAACAGARIPNTKTLSVSPTSQEQIDNQVEINILNSGSSSSLYDVETGNVAPMFQSDIEQQANQAKHALRRIEHDRNTSALTAMNTDRFTCFENTYRPYVGMPVTKSLTIDASLAYSHPPSSTSSVSASPSSGNHGDVWWDAEVVIRPTGILDPIVHIRPSASQISDLLDEIKTRITINERVLVTCLTKRMAEDLSLFFQSKQLKSTFLYSGVKPMDRLEIIRSLRRGEVDILVGVNLLREGLNLPEVSLVAILDADKEGFLRSDTALIQTIGRASRHVKGSAILYADRMTGSMIRAIDETDRRRRIQLDYNKEMGIKPKQAYAITTEDSILSLVELQALLEGKVKETVTKSDVERITAKLSGGRLAYAQTEEQEAQNSYRYDANTSLSILIELRDEANEAMVAATAKRKYELSICLRNARDEISKEIEIRDSALVA